MDLGLKNQIAMVSGASKGLGFAVAKILAEEGARISISSSRREAIEEAAVRLRNETSAEVLPVVCDVRSADAIDSWRDQTVEQFGGVDLLFCNSGGPPAGGFLQFDDDAWQNGIALLLLSAVRMARSVIPLMQSRGGGSIVFSTSSSVKEPIPNLTLSNVIRGAVSSLSKSLAREFAAEGIRVNQAVPGRIETDRLMALDEGNAKRQNISVDEQRNRMIATIPMNRYGQPDEFARGVVFLLSKSASYINGATLQVDGCSIRSVL